MWCYLKLIVSIIMAGCLFFPFFKTKSHIIDVQVGEAGQMLPKVISKNLEHNALESMGTLGMDWLGVLELAVLSLSIISCVCLLFKLNNRMLEHLNAISFILAFIGFVVIMYLSSTQQAHY